MTSFGNDDQQTRTDTPIHDEASYRTLRRFAMTLAIILGGASLAQDRLPENGLAVLMIAASLVTAYIGSFLREPFCGPALNRWDETLAYCCLGYLALIVT